MASEKRLGAPLPGGPQTVLEAQRREIIGLLMVALGLVLIFSFVAAHASSEMVGRRNELGVGIVVLTCAGIRFISRDTTRVDVIIIVAGAWLVGAPAALTQISEGSRILDRITGGLLVFLGLLSLAMAWAGRRNATAGRAAVASSREHSPSRR